MTRGQAGNFSNSPSVFFDARFGCPFVPRRLIACQALPSNILPAHSISLVGPSTLNSFLPAPTLMSWDTVSQAVGTFDRPLDISPHVISVFFKPRLRPGKDDLFLT